MTFGIYYKTFSFSNGATTIICMLITTWQVFFFTMLNCMFGITAAKDLVRRFDCYSIMYNMISKGVSIEVLLDEDDSEKDK